MIKGKVILITGSSVGIGAETAYIFSKHNAKVIITYYKDKEKAIDAANKCVELGASETLAVHLNVKDTQSIKSALKEITDKFGHIDILINNAGVIVWKKLINQTDFEIEDQIRTNLEGLIKVTKYFLPIIKEQILNVSSGAGKQAYADLSAYCATKFGVRGFTQSLSIERPDLKIISINPGMTATKMTNYQGASPEKVAKVIFDAATGKIKADSNLDVDVWKIMK